MKAPFPYFGGKSRVADQIWHGVGHDVRHYVEPFGGSLAVYLHPDTPPQGAALNDLDGLLVNFWRAVKFAPDEVAHHTIAPNSTIELASMHNAVVRERDALLSHMVGDPGYFDARVAAYWLYARCAMIGGRGIFERPIGMRLPEMQGRGVLSRSYRDTMTEQLQQLANHLRGCVLTCSPWQSVLTRSALYKRTPTFVFLDPPYADGEFDDGVYENGGGVWSDVVAWCREHGSDERLRIVLCGYEDTADLPGWSRRTWSTGGGMAVIHGGGRGIENGDRECIWFSPHCALNQRQSTLF